ncbi:MAG TPA: hypothetical protein VIY51_20735 [Xanthobacteraceae bacterium]
MSDDAVIAAGAVAWRRLRGGKSFDDWILVARALSVGRVACMRLAGCNKPVGSRYNSLMGQWLAQHGFDTITTQERYRALQVLDNISEIETWRAGLDDAQRRKVNHPGTVWSHWRHQGGGAERVQIDRVLGAYRSPVTPNSAVNWPDQLVEAGAEALKTKYRSGDFFVMMSVVLRAILPDQAALQTLVEYQAGKPRTPAAPRKAAAQDAPACP